MTAFASTSSNKKDRREAERGTEEAAHDLVVTTPVETERNKRSSGIEGFVVRSS
jgi:hypothetical protein